MTSSRNLSPATSTSFSERRDAVFAVVRHLFYDAMQPQTFDARATPVPTDVNPMKVSEDTPLALALSRKRRTNLND
jgi:hypothetical protein